MQSISSLRSKLLQRLAGYLQNAVRHSQIADMQRNPLSQKLRCLLTLLRQHRRRTSQLYNSLCHSLLRLLQRQRNILQLRILRLRRRQIIKHSLRRTAVLLLQAVNDIQTLLHLGSTLAVKIAARHIFTQLAATVIKRNPCAVGALC